MIQPANGTVIGQLRGEFLNLRGGPHHGQTYTVLLVADSAGRAVRGVGGVRYTLQRRWNSR